METTTTNSHLILHDADTILPGKRNADPSRFVIARLDAVTSRLVIHSVGRNYMLSQVRTVGTRTIGPYLIATTDDVSADAWVAIAGLAVSMIAQEIREA